MFGPPAYEHTQKGWLQWVVYGNAAALLVVLYFIPNNPVLSVVFPLLAALLLVVALAVGQLTVRDESEELVIEFGPLHLFRKRVAYADLVDVETARSRWIDGWGIHYGLGEGWIWNVSGYDCVRLTLKGNRRLRIGTDDPEGLCAFLRTKMETV